MDNKIVGIIEAVAKEYDLTKDVLISRQKDDNVAEARNIVIYLCRKKTNCSAQEIGEYFGNRDHTTILHAEKSVQKKMESDTEFAEKIEQMERGKLNV